MTYHVWYHLPRRHFGSLSNPARPGLLQVLISTTIIHGSFDGDFQTLKFEAIVFRDLRVFGFLDCWIAGSLDCGSQSP